jgi:hypothetical protein
MCATSCLLARDGVLRRYDRFLRGAVSNVAATGAAPLASTNSLTSPSLSSAPPVRRDIHYVSSSGAVKRGSFKATQLQPRHQHEVATSAAAAAAAAENEEGGAAGSGGAFIAPLPPILGGQGAGGVRGELPEGMYFIGVGVFMMEVMQP